MKLVSEVGVGVIAAGVAKVCYVLVSLLILLLSKFFVIAVFCIGKFSALRSAPVLCVDDTEVSVSG